MLKNFLKIALRNLTRQKFYSIINITGLAVGMACCLVIVLFVQDELSYDQHHEKSDRIYRATSDINFGGNHMRMAVMPAPTAEALVNDFPNVEAAVRFRQQGSFLVGYDGNTLKEQSAVFVDNSVFDVFTIPLLSGDAATALEKPNTLVLSEEAAKRHFGEADPMGKQLLLDNKDLYVVTGVMKPMPSNSHFHFDILLSMVGLEEAKNTVWLSNNFQTYFVLAENSDPDEFAKNLTSLVDTYVAPQAMQMLDISMEDMEASGSWVRYGMEPLTDIHLQSDLDVGFEPGGDIKYVYIFLAIAFIILTIACINFMNLSTARSANRAKEVGVRKVLGSYRSHLVAQFLSESVLLSVLAGAIAIALAQLAIPLFNDLAAKTLSIPFDNPMLYGILGSSALLIGILAGAYPAFFLSAFRPAAVLKGRLNQGAKSGLLRSTLVVVQFCTSIFLIVGTLIVYQQLDYIQNKNLGFSKDQVLLISDAYALGDNLNGFKNKVLQNSNVKSATISSYLPVNSSRSNSAFWPEGEVPDETNSVMMENWRVDQYYLETMQMEIVNGRNFSEDFPSDSTAMILNEKAASLFGWEDPIGKNVLVMDRPDPTTNQTAMIPFKVVGIVKDFHFESLKDNISALCLRLGSSRGYVAIRTNSADYASLITDVETAWKELGEGQPFQYRFMDEAFDNMYRSEQRIGKIAFTFSGLAIFIACLGLFGLAAFTAEQRTKEIGVRKVMGASIQSIIIMLSKEFAKVIAIAMVFAIPLTWYVMNLWLQDFYFRIEIGPGVFILGGVLTLIIAWITMSWQSVKAAVANPVDSLKEE